MCPVCMTTAAWLLQAAPQEPVHLASRRLKFRWSRRPAQSHRIATQGQPLPEAAGVEEAAEPMSRTESIGRAEARRDS